MVDGRLKARTCSPMCALDAFANFTPLFEFYNIYDTGPINAGIAFPEFVLLLLPNMCPCLLIFKESIVCLLFAFIMVP